MLWILDRIVTVWHTQQYLLADCSIIKHQPQRKLVFQQLNTATGRYWADWRVMTADVVWTACQANGVELQPGSEEPYHSVNDIWLSQAWTEHALRLSTSGNWQMYRCCDRSIAGQQCKFTTISLIYVDFTWHIMIVTNFYTVPNTTKKQFNT